MSTTVCPIAEVEGQQTSTSSAPARPTGLLESSYIQVSGPTATAVGGSSPSETVVGDQTGSASSSVYVAAAPSSTVVSGDEGSAGGDVSIPIASTASPIYPTGVNANPLIVGTAAPSGVSTISTGPLSSSVPFVPASAAGTIGVRSVGIILSVVAGILVL